MNINAGFWLTFGALFFLWLLFGSSRTSNNQQNEKTVTGGSVFESLRRGDWFSFGVISRPRLLYAMVANAPVLGTAFVAQSLGNWRAFALLVAIPFFAAMLIPQVHRIQTPLESKGGWILGFVWLAFMVYWFLTL